MAKNFLLQKTSISEEMRAFWRKTEFFKKMFGKGANLL